MKSRILIRDKDLFHSFSSAFICHCGSNNIRCSYRILYIFIVSNGWSRLPSLRWLHGKALSISLSVGIPFRQTQRASCPKYLSEPGAPEDAPKYVGRFRSVAFQARNAGNLGANGSRERWRSGGCSAQVIAPLLTCALLFLLHPSEARPDGPWTHPDG